jgi:mono/diheme cytochrome c family protein
MSEQVEAKSTGWLGIIPKILALIGSIVLVLLLVILVVVGPFPGNNTSASFTDIDEHFKYGSIGGESSNGIPYWLWKVLPEMFPEKLPGKGYQSLGFVQESGQKLPIGFAKSKVNGLEVITQNCATCHVGTLRSNPNSKTQIIATMPSHQLDLEGYIKFLGEVALDPRFNPREIMPYIEASGAKLNPIEKLLYRFVAIPQTRDALIIQGKKFAFLERQIAYGPGRVDTFTPYKALRFNISADRLAEDELRGITDFPPVWQQGPREGMKLHWDGNNTSIDERNKSAALALVAPTTINFPSVFRVRDWLLEVPPPRYPYPINPELAALGEKLYQNTCATCHAFKGAKVGTVEPIEEIGTDRGRLDSYTYELASNQYTLFAGITFNGEDQRFTKFRKTNGYANMPLDGVWLRAPYLHNGSVPTLRDLLEKPENRPPGFYRGYDVFDPQKVGFVSNVAQENGKQYFKYDTSLPGNSNQGHVYGTNLSSEEKDALVEYMKKL